MSIVKLTQDLDMQPYNRDLEKALALMLSVSGYLTKEHVADLLRTYNIGSNFMKAGVEFLDQHQVDDGADVMRHIAHLCEYYLSMDQKNWKVIQDVLVEGYGLVGIVELEVVIDTLKIRCIFNSSPAVEAVG